MSIFEKSESYRPFKYPDFVAEEKKQRIDMKWSEDQIDLSDDLRQYMTKGGLSTPNYSHEHNKRVLDSVLPLFTEMDSAVGQGYSQLLPYVGNNEVRALLMVQAATEVTHFRGYALANETFGFPESSWLDFKRYKEMQDKVDLLTSNSEDLRDKLNWCKKLGTILLGEGIGLFGSFTALLNFKRFGLLMGFNDVNQWSLLDETEHVSCNIKILNEARKDLTDVENKSLTDFLKACSEAYVAAEHEFINLVGDLEDLPQKDLAEYITYLGKYRLYQLGVVGSLELPKNPLKWMDWLMTGAKHDNFFEKRVTDYSHSKLVGTIDYGVYQ